jgi:hypothetical protein
MKVRPLLALVGWLALTLVPLPGPLNPLVGYVWLGVIPGLALSAVLTPRVDLLTRAGLALALSPVVSAAAGWALIHFGAGVGAAARAIAIVGALGAAAAFGIRWRREPNEPVTVPRSAVAWAATLAAILIAIPLLNPFILVRSDSWLHGGIVMELLTRGMPPEDPRMAGLGLNYVWFFNLFIALLTGWRGQDPFFFMTLFNAATGFATVALVAVIAQRLWNRAQATLGAVALLTLGLNAGAYLLWPLILVKLVVGKVQGGDEFARIAADFAPGTTRILYSLSAPFAEMVSFLDKLTEGTALAFAYLQMIVFLWAMVRWFGDRRRDALAVAACAAAGMMFFHSVVGLSVLPVGLAVLAIAWLGRSRWPWLPRRAEVLALGAATLAGLVIALPYTRSITAGWAPEKSGLAHHFLSFNTLFPWTLATSCCFPLWFARRPLLAAWRERRMPHLLLAAFAALMIGFACVVNLPERNFVKFVFECFVPLVLLGAPAFVDFVGHLWRTRRGVAAVALPLLFAVPTLATIHGDLADPERLTSPRLRSSSGETAMDDWIQGSTPPEAVFVDRGFRDLLMVKARRRLYLGTDLPPERAAFPVSEMRARQHTMADLYGTLADSVTTVERLRALGRPIYVLYRPGDSTGVDFPWQRLLEAAPGSTLSYEQAGFRIVKVSLRSGS